MAANTSIPDHYVTEFATNWQHLVQQKQSRLKEYVNLDVIKGKEKSYNHMASTAMRLITGRAATTTAQNTTLSKRWLREQGYDAVDVVDEFDNDQLGTIVLPTSEFVMNHAMAYKRTCDQVIIDALGGSAYTGATGTTATALPKEQIILANYVKTNPVYSTTGWGTSGGASLGLTLDKIIKAKSILATAEVDDEEPLIFVYSQEQLDDLLNNVTEIKSSDYVQIQALIAGTIDKFMGFKWVRSQLLPESSTDIRSCYAYAKSGLTLGDSGQQVYMDVLPTQSHSLQIRTVARLGATRREEEKVVKILCDQSP